MIQESKTMRPHKSLRIFYTTLILLIVYLKFSLTRSIDDQNVVDWDDELDDGENNKLLATSNTNRVRLSVELPPSNRHRVRQDIYNFYNGQQQPARPNNNYYRPRPRPPRPPRPIYPDSDYYYEDDAPADPTYYQPSRPYRQPYYPYPTPPPPPPPTTTTTTTTPALPTSDPTQPIGYMLIDTHHTPAGSYSRPIAFFGG